MSATLGKDAGTHQAGNRFLLCVVAFHRTRQLMQGAAPRLAGDGHKSARLAVLEVMADTISWSRV